MKLQKLYISLGHITCPWRTCFPSWIRSPSTCWQREPSLLQTHLKHTLGTLVVCFLLNLGLAWPSKLSLTSCPLETWQESFRHVFMSKKIGKKIIGDQGVIIRPLTHLEHHWWIVRWKCSTELAHNETIVDHKLVNDFVTTKSLQFQNKAFSLWKSVWGDSLSFTVIKFISFLTISYLDIWMLQVPSWMRASQFHNSLADLTRITCM